MLKKIKNKFAEVIVVLWMALIIVSFVVDKAKATPLEQKIYPPGMINPVPLPMFCGYTVAIIPHTMATFEMKNMFSGEIRTGGMKTGEIIGYMSFWHNIEDDTGVFYMTLDGTSQTCLVGYGVNFKWDEEYMIDVVNEVINEDNTSTQ